MDMEQLELPRIAGVRICEHILSILEKMTVSYKVKHTSNYDPGILLLGKA